MADRPLCACHDHPMYSDRNGRGRVGWRCAVRKLAVNQRHYENYTGVEYSRRLLQIRRYKALARRRQREENRDGEVQTEGRD